jgi:hypothetical protein
MHGVRRTPHYQGEKPLISTDPTSHWHTNYLDSLNENCLNGLFFRYFR